MIKFAASLFYLTAIFNIHAQSIELPTASNSAAVARHNYYTLEYNDDTELSRWVAYELTAEEVRGTTPRRDDFRGDPHITTGSAGENDYRGTGFDRGHLAPAGDMKITPQAMSESFYMSNIAPQRPDFNRGIWLTLENTVRTWAVENGAALIAVGPILDQREYQRIGSSGVAVPERFYKVILDYREPELKGIGFILPNRGSREPLQSYAVTIDEVERQTGIDFYSLLADDDEERLESSFDLSLWNFTEYRGEYRVSFSPESNEGTAPYWINISSDTRHNSSCRYYGNTKRGRFTNEAAGTACGICGG